MSEQFTPGPWQSKHDHSKEGVCTIIANVDGDTHSDGSTTYSYDFICTCEDEFGEYTECAQANARLICAAPKLYAALLTLLDEYETDLFQACADPAIAQGRAALREARGETA